MARVMSDAEIRRRKKLQGHISQTTSTLGLTGLGVTGAAALAARKPGVLKQVQKLPGMKTTTPHKMKDVAINTGLVSGGIGGVGGYNFASYTNAESRKRQQVVPPKKKRVVKSMSIEMGHYGEEGRRLSSEEIEKAWAPSASTFDSERSRKKRAKAYEGASLVGAGAGGAATAHYGGKLGGELKRLKPEKMAPFGEKGKPLPTKATHVVPVGHLKKPAGKAGAAAAVLGGSVLANKKIRQKRKKSWQSYSSD